jgi:hypothetical protein
MNSIYGKKAQMFRFLAELSSPLLLNTQTMDKWFSQALEGARNLINLERLFIYHLDSDNQGIITHEAIAPGWTSIEDREHNSELIPPALLKNYKKPPQRIFGLQSN